MDAKLQGYIDKLNALNFKDMYNGDFFLTWEKTDEELVSGSSSCLCGIAGRAAACHGKNHSACHNGG